LGELLVIFYIGPYRPTLKEFAKLPLLVRHFEVMQALTWLILNHSDFQGVTFSPENLQTYSETSPPVEIIFSEIESSSSTTINPSQHENPDNDINIDENETCPFVMHALIGQNYDELSFEQKKMAAYKWFNDNNGVLAVGHTKEPTAIRNPRIYGMMF
ncbi:hypothetical protein BDZ89DRAFT_933680, partial [Hymenopellis radicata]